MNRILRILALSAAVLPLISSTSSAELINRTLEKSGLTQEDIAMLEGAASSLYDVETPKPGSSTVWRNEGTGSYGAIRLDTVSEGCVVIRHVMFPRGKDTMRKLTTRRCQNTEGEWVLAP